MHLLLTRGQHTNLGHRWCLLQCSHPEGKLKSFDMDNKFCFHPCCHCRCCLMFSKHLSMFKMLPTLLAWDVPTGPSTVCPCSLPLPSHPSHLYSLCLPSGLAGGVSFAEVVKNAPDFVCVAKPADNAREVSCLPPQITSHPCCKSNLASQELFGMKDCSLLTSVRSLP